MTTKRYDANFRLREDILDSITPNVEVQPQIRNPAGDWKPADWLPVQWTSSNVSAGEDAFVCSWGKAVAFDSTGRLVPAGLRTALGGNGATSVIAGTVLTYTADDVSWKVTDLVTGVAVTAPVTYNGEQVCDALIERGLVDETEAEAAVTVPAAADADVNGIIDLFISRPVGIAAYDFHVWSGRPEDGDQRYTNYSKQNAVQFLTEIQLQVPQRVAGTATAEGFDFDALNTAGTATYAAGDFVQAGGYWDIANIRQITRFGALSATAPVAAFGFANRKVAANTTRTPITCDTAGVLVRERLAATDIAKDGDWYVDLATGTLFIHTDTFATLVALGTVNTDFNYSFYTDTGTASAHRHVHFDGPVRPGEWVVVDAESNFTAASAAQIAASEETVGRVLAIKKEPTNLLQHVKTAWNVTGMSAAGQMPGTATNGFTDLITLSGETVADQVVILNIRV